MGSQGTRHSNSADLVAAKLRDLIVTGHLSPGEQIRQVQMADELGVSRAPLREALKQLTSEGLVTHQHNSGYAVARMSRAQFDQIYLMRGVLEREVLRNLPKLTGAELAEVKGLSEAVVDASERMDLIAMQRHNQEFHFAIFGHSELDLVVQELERLWHWAAPYHAVYLFDSAGREDSIREHREMLKALAAHDNEKLIELMDHHRLGGAEHLMLRFQRFGGDDSPLTANRVGA